MAETYANIMNPMRAHLFELAIAVFLMAPALACVSSDNSITPSQVDECAANDDPSGSGETDSGDRGGEDSRKEHPPPESWAFAGQALDPGGRLLRTPLVRKVGPSPAARHLGARRHTVTTRDRLRRLIAQARCETIPMSVVALPIRVHGPPALA